MKYFSWSVEKNDRLRSERGVTFEEVVFLKTIIPSRKMTRKYLGDA